VVTSKVHLHTQSFTCFQTHLRLGIQDVSKLKMLEDEVLNSVPKALHISSDSANFLHFNDATLQVLVDVKHFGRDTVVKRHTDDIEDGEVRLSVTST
jgi:hypothetical protein